VCLVERLERFGWVVDDIKGPRNSDVDPHVLDVLQRSFTVVDVPPIAVIYPLQAILLGHTS